MPKLEFGQLYKFVVSLGFILMAAAFVGPWAILRDQGALLVTESSLRDLTPRAQDVLEAKQVHAERIIEWYPWIALGVLVLGASISIWGLRHWWKRQKVADEREDVGLAAERRQLQPLTPEETARRLDEEVEAATQDSVEGGGLEGAAELEPIEPRSRPRGPGDPVDEEMTSIREYVRQRYREVESLAASRLRAAFGVDRSVSTSMKIIGERAGQMVGADIVALARHPTRTEPSLVFEVKLTTPRNATRQAEAALIGAARFAVFLHPLAAAVALLIVNDEEEKERVLPGVSKAIDRLQRVLNAPNGAVVFTTDELSSLAPAELRRQVLGSLLDPRHPLPMWYGGSA